MTATARPRTFAFRTSGVLSRWLSILVMTAAIVLATAAAAEAQEGAIEGTVESAATNQPLGNVQVFIQGTEIGTITSGDGTYRLTGVPTGEHTVQARLIGYQPTSRSVTVEAGALTRVDFALSQSAVELDEVVVTGTAGASTRRDLGTSVGVIDEELVESTPANNTSDLLYGNVTGLTQMTNTGQVGGGSQIQLRGFNSVTQSSQPLIYIDGVRINNNSAGASNPGPAGAQTSPNPLDNLDPANIARIEVVRGAAATTLYGTEAAGGVIQIFTKQAETGQNASWQVNLTGGANYVTGNNLGPVIGDHESWLFFKPWARTGPTYGGTASVQAGTEALRYYFSGSYNRAEGVVDNNNSRRFHGRGNFAFEPIDGLQIRFNTMFSRRDTRYMEGGDNTYGFMLNVFRGDQDYTQEHGDSILFDIEDRGGQSHFVGGVTMTHNPTQALVSRLSLGYDVQDAFNEQNIPFDFPLYPQGQRDVNEWTHRKLTLDYNTTWTQELTDALTSTATWGGQIFYDEDHTVYGLSEDFGGPGNKTLSSGATRRSGEDILRDATAGFFVQEKLGYRDRLFVTGGLRMDGNSAFGEDLGLEAYPKISGSFILSDLNWWPDWWRVMKLRAAYGESGKAPGYFDAQQTWEPVSGYEGKPGVTPDNLGNPTLGPERSKEIELGFEASMFEDRLGVDFTAYRSRTTDALFPVSEPPSTGFTQPQLRNVGKMENRGIEVSLTAVPIETDFLRWEIQPQGTLMDSEVLDLGSAPEFVVGWGSILGQWVREGQPIIGLYGDKVTNSDEVAEPQWSEDQLYGPVYPTKSFTLSTNVNFAQRLTLRAMGEFNGGHYQFNIMPWQEVRRGLWPQCNERQPISEATAIWRARCATPAPPLDVWNMPADYFKLRTASLNYELPSGALPGTSQSSVTLMFRNLWKWQESPGVDPELNTGTAGTFPARYEYYQIPPSTSVTLTLRASF